MAPAMMTSPMVPVIRSIVDMITSWKDIAATPALIACAAEFRTMRMGDFLVTRSLTKRADPATSASLPGGRRPTPARFATSDVPSSALVSIALGRSNPGAKKIVGPLGDALEEIDDPCSVRCPVGEIWPLRQRDACVRARQRRDEEL